MNRFTMQQPYMLPVLHRQYHSCWCPEDLRSQGISVHSIHQISQNIPFLASETFKHRNNNDDLNKHTLQVQHLHIYGGLYKNSHHFTHHILKYNYLNENYFCFMNFTEFWTGDKPLPDPMMTKYMYYDARTTAPLPTHHPPPTTTTICIKDTLYLILMEELRRIFCGYLDDSLEELLKPLDNERDISTFQLQP